MLPVKSMWFPDITNCFILKINYCFLCFQLRAQNQVLKKGVVDEQANSAALKVGNRVFVLWGLLAIGVAQNRFIGFSGLKFQLLTLIH